MMWLLSPGKMDAPPLEHGKVSIKRFNKSTVSTRTWQVGALSYMISLVAHSIIN
jgi:hypothetical protein